MYSSINVEYLRYEKRFQYGLWQVELFFDVSPNFYLDPYPQQSCNGSDPKLCSKNLQNKKYITDYFSEIIYF